MRMICLPGADRVRLLLLLLLLLDAGMSRGLGNQLHRQLAVLRLLLVSGGRRRDGDRDAAPLDGHLLLLLHPLLHLLRTVWMLLLLLLLVGIHLLLLHAMFWRGILLRVQLGTRLLWLLGDRVTVVGVSANRPELRRMRSDPSGGEGIGIVLLEVRVARPVELLLLLLLLQ